MYCTRNEQYMCGLAWPSGVVHHPQALCAVSSRVWVRVPVMLPVPLSKALNQNEQGLLVLSKFYEIGPFSFTLVLFSKYSYCHSQVEMEMAFTPEKLPELHTA